MLLERTRRLLDRLLAKKSPTEPTDPGVSCTLDGQSAVALIEALISEAAGLGGPAPEDPDARALLDALTHAPAGTPQVSLREDLLDPGDGPRGALTGALGMALSGLRTTAFLHGRELLGLSDLLAQAAQLQIPLVVHTSLTAQGAATRATGDGHDAYHAIAETGVVQFFAKDPQQAVDFALIARRLSETALIPTLIAMDAAGTGTREAQLSLPTADLVRRYLGLPKDFVDSATEAQALLFGPRRRRLVRWHDLDRPVLLGGIQGQESWPLTRAGRATFFDREVPRLLTEAFETFGQLTGRHYGPTFEHGLAGADLVLVCQGSLLDLALEGAEQLQAATKHKVGVLGLHVLRPFMGERIAHALTRRPAVLTLERSARSLGGPSPLGAELHQVMDRAMQNGQAGQQVYAGYPSWSLKDRPRLFTAYFGHGATPQLPDLIQHGIQVLSGKAAAEAYLGIEAAPDLRAWPKRQAMQDSLPASARLLNTLKTSSGAPSAPSGRNRGLPESVRHVRSLDPTLAGLPRFWDQVGALYAGEAQGSLGLDPYLATGAMPVLSASFQDVSSVRENLPALAPERCTGCGVCWSTCPEGAIGAAALTPAQILEAGMQEAARCGHPSEALRPLLKKIGQAALRAAQVPDAPTTAGALLRSVFEPILDKAASDDRRRATLEVAFATSVAEIEDLPTSNTDIFLTRPSQTEPGGGRLLSLNFDPDTCKGCGLCVTACADGALTALVDSTERTEALRKLRQHWLHLPDTDGALIDTVGADPALGPLAANLLSRHSVGLVGGDEVEPGSGERQALRLVLAAAEAERQRASAHQLGRLQELQDKLSAKIHSLLEATLPVHDLQALSKGLESLGRQDVDLAALSSKMSGAIDAGRVDAVFLHRLTEAASTLADLRFTLAEGSQGLGRARYGLVLCQGTFAEGLTRFPNNPFTAPVVAAHPRAAARLARGLFEGQLSVAQAVFAAVADAERLLTYKSKLPYDEGPPALPSYESLDTETRRLVPPVFLIGDEATLGESELGSVLALLGSDRPFKVVVLADPGRRLGPGGGAPPPELGTVAITHRQAYVAQSSVAFPRHFGPAVQAAIQFEGPALMHLYTPSPQRDGIKADASLSLARLAVSSRTFPLFTYDPRRSGVLGSRIDLSGNPDIEHPWVREQQVKLTPADWLSAQGRFDAHFSPASPTAIPVSEWLEQSPREGAPALTRPDGSRVSPGPRLLAAIERWSLGWRALQELAGEVTPFTARVEAEAEARLKAKYEADMKALVHKHADALAQLQQAHDDRTASRVTQRLMELAGFGHPERGEVDES